MVHVTPKPILIGERIQQLDMLLHIQEFSSMVVVVTGDALMGKTALLNAASEHLSIHHQVIQFSAAEIQTEDTLVPFIAQQLGVDNDWVSIEQAITSFNSNSESINVLIDDAHLLSYDLLQMLSVRAVREQGWHLVLAGDSVLVETMQKVQEGLHHTNLIHRIELTGISEDEASEFAIAYFQADASESMPLSAQKIVYLWRVAQGNPGKLHELLVLESHKVIAKTARFPIGHVAAVCLIGLALGVSYFYQSEPADQQDDVIARILESEKQGITVEKKSVISKQAANNSQQQKAKTKPTSPFQVTQNNEQGTATSKKTAAPTTKESTPLVKTETQKQVEAIAIEQSTVAATKPLESVKVKENNHPLLKVSANTYALQLVGLRSKKSANQILKKFEASLGVGKLSLYETTYQDEPWYVVVYGPMNSRDAASKQAGIIAKDFKSQPWIRPMAKIQEDIRKLSQ